MADAEAPPAETPAAEGEAPVEAPPAPVEPPKPRSPAKPVISLIVLPFFDARVP